MLKFIVFVLAILIPNMSMLAVKIFLKNKKV